MESDDDGTQRHDIQQRHRQRNTRAAEESWTIMLHGRPRFDAQWESGCRASSLPS